MSVNNSKKEYLFTIFLKLNKEIIEHEIGIKIKDIHLEKWFKNRKVDMNGIDIDGGRLLIELQTDENSYKNHCRQIQDLIAVANAHERTTIVYVALQLREEMLMELMQDIVFFSEKNIELILLQINSKVIPILREINVMDQVTQIKELDRLKVIKNIFIDNKGIKVYNSSKIISAEIEDEKEIYSYEERLLIDIVKRLRYDCPDICTNLHQYKYVNSKSFTMGAGYGGITYKLRCNRKGQVAVELAFEDKPGKEMFYKLLEVRDKIDDDFDFILKWDERYQKIGTYYPISWFVNDKEKIMVKRFCRDVKKYILGFNTYLKQAMSESKI